LFTPSPTLAEKAELHDVYGIEGYGNDYEDEKDGERGGEVNRCSAIAKLLYARARSPTPYSRSFASISSTRITVSSLLNPSQESGSSGRAVGANTNSLLVDLGDDDEMICDSSNDRVDTILRLLPLQGKRGASSIVSTARPRVFLRRNLATKPKDASRFTLIEWSLDQLMVMAQHREASRTSSRSSGLGDTAWAAASPADVSRLGQEEGMSVDEKKGILER
jgi:hypothetical protein